MKKICFVTTIYGTFDAFLAKFSEFLDQSGEYEVSLICDGASMQGYTPPACVTVHPIEIQRGISLSGVLSVIKIYRILKKNHFDIVQYSTPNAAFYTSIAAKLARVPHRLYGQWGIRYMGFHGFSRKIFKLLERITCCLSTFVEVESHHLRTFAIEEKLYPASKSAVIWNGSAAGVDLEKFDISKRDAWRREIREKYGIDTASTVLAFAGRLTADKGVNELLEAFFSLPKDSGALLMIMGAFDDTSLLNFDLLDRAKKDDRVIFCGRVKDVEKHFAAADLFIAPSYREGFGIVVIEAGAMGLGSIVSDVPGQIDAIEKDVTGVAVPVKDAGALSKAMLSLIGDREKCDAMGRAAHDFVAMNFEQRKLFARLKQQRDQMIEDASCRK